VQSVRPLADRTVMQMTDTSGTSARTVFGIVLGILALAVLVTGCRTSGLLFTKSSDFRILSPASSAEVKLPLRVTWTAGGSYRPGDRFAVFLDRGTIGPGENLSKLIPDACKKAPSCSGETFLQQEKVYVTSSPEVILATLPRSSVTGHSTGKEDHSVTVVILDSSGARVGEAFASTDFIYIRKGV
jgi:hypothetical protein